MNKGGSLEKSRGGRGGIFTKGQGVTNRLWSLEDTCTLMLTAAHALAKAYTQPVENSNVARQPVSTDLLGIEGQHVLRQRFQKILPNFCSAERLFIMQIICIMKYIVDLLAFPTCKSFQHFKNVQMSLSRAEKLQTFTVSQAKMIKTQFKVT